MIKRSDSMMMVAGAAALGAAYWLGVDRPQQRRLEAIRDELSLLRSEVALQTARAGDLNELSERTRQAEAALANYRRRVPRSAELGAFVAEVSDLAGRLGLREQNLVPLTAETRGPLTVLPIRMEFAARFDAAFGFLKEVRELSRVARVSELRLERPEPFRGELKAELTLQVFYEAA